MAFIRRRTTKNGVTSTALVESYRRAGKPRHRILANLHGAASAAEALGRLAAERDGLRKERAKLEPHISNAQDWVDLEEELFDLILGCEKRKEVDETLRWGKRLLKRIAEIDLRLARIQKEGVIIKKHCSAGPEEIRAHASRWAKHLYDMECFKLGQKFMLAQGLAEMRKSPDFLAKLRG